MRFLFLSSANCLIQSVIRLCSNQLIWLPVPPGRMTRPLSGTVKQQVQIHVSLQVFLQKHLIA